MKARKNFHLKIIEYSLSLNQVERKRNYEVSDHVIIFGIEYWITSMLVGFIRNWHFFIKDLSLWK